MRSAEFDRDLVLRSAMEAFRARGYAKTTMQDLVEKNPRNHFQLSAVKGIRPNIVREHGKTILDLLKYLPEQQADWPLRMARPIRHSSSEIADRVEAVIQNISEETAVPKEVLMRKKWLSALYQHVVFHNDEQDLPGYLLGWRYDMLTKPLIDVLHSDESYLSKQMKVME